MNTYKHILKQNIQKLLNLYNTDKFSATYGYADREFWGWKTKDFTNATLQGGIHSLAIFLKLGLFEKNQEIAILEIIDSSILAIEKIKDKNGSLVEAYPSENSFCVTALVAFDILSAINYLDDRLDKNIKQKYFSVVQPLINFITKNGEEHAIISNHLATGVAAIVLWNHLTGDNNQRDKELLQIIYDHQSAEGWYREYEGADPGYQTLCTYYLSCAYEITKDKMLLESLKISANFLSHFIHPDGTIGGLYGSRNTEVFYPAGIVALSGEIEEFALMAKYLEPNGQHLLPQNIDIGNYIPFLNSYALAALKYDEVKENIEKIDDKPFYAKNEEKDFKQTGIYLVSNKNYFAIFNYKKGGTLKVFDKNSGKLDIEDGGLFGTLNDGTKFSTQQFDENITFQNKKIQANFYKMNESSPNPLNFIILRVLSLTVFRFVFLGNLFKKFIVNMLMTGKNKLDGSVTREFEFLEDKVIVKEEIAQPKNCKDIKHIGKSKAIHMASSGYFISQNFENNNSKIVEFKNV
ncbi:hypothetical protein [Aliarcobacter cryaerophilus]|uniref:hypothetical protein n=1 Tax=Aliarcobacter cryaerophilus TaxID=28198 RepID=UPI00112F54B1|nr:hypothetical protein [Aliarcobacter cryaerophilus]